MNSVDVLHDSIKLCIWWRLHFKTHFIFERLEIMLSASTRMLNTGAPHFKSMRRLFKNASYTLPKIMKEYIDNAVKIARHVDTRVIVSPETGYIKDIKISDDYEKGFEDLNKSGIDNPFTIGHFRDGQTDDDNPNEYGVGGKAAAIAAGGLYTIYTKVEDICYRIDYDFDHMETILDISESHKPNITIISIEEYRNKHPFEHGSTIILGRLNPKMHEITSHVQITKELSREFSDAYSNFIIDGFAISINDQPVVKEHNWLMDQTCQTFNINTKIFILENPNDQSATREMFCARTDKNTIYKKYVRSGSGSGAKNKLVVCKKKEIDSLLAKGYIYMHRINSNSVHSIDINSTTAFYSNDFHGENHDEVEKPLNSVHIYKNQRKYGSFTFEHRTDGNHNYNYHRIDLRSKELGKELGITFNKELSMIINNDLTRMIRECIGNNNSNLNSNTSTDKNAENCERYLNELNIDILTCKVEKLSSKHRKLRDDLVKYPQPPIIQDPVVVVQPAEAVVDVVVDVQPAEAVVDVEGVVIVNVQPQLPSPLTTQTTPSSGGQSAVSSYIRDAPLSEKDGLIKILEIYNSITADDIKRAIINAKDKIVPGMASDVRSFDSIALLVRELETKSVN